MINIFFTVIINIIISVLSNNNQTNLTNQTNTIFDAKKIFFISDTNFFSIYSSFDIMIFLQNNTNPNNNNLVNTFLTVANQLESVYPTLGVAILDIEKYPMTHKLLDNNKNSTVWLVHSDNLPGYGFFGKFTIGNMLKWVNKFYISPISTQLNNETDIIEFTKSGGSFVIFFGNDKGNQFKTFNEVSKTFYNITFGHCSEKSCYDHYKVKQGDIILIRSEDDTYFKLVGGFTKKRLTKFIKANVLPMISSVK